MTLTTPVAVAALDSEPVVARAERVVLRPVVADAEVRDRARRGLARIAALAAPHLCPLRGIEEGPEGFRLTYDVPASALTWADLTGRRDPSTAETVGVGLAVCAALQPLHAAGLAHGVVTADRVLIGPYGTVELTDAGAAQPGTETAAVTPAGDVAAFASVLAAALPDGSVDSSLALLLVRALDPDGSARPTVAALALALESQCAPEPVRVLADAAPSAAPASQPPGPPDPAVSSAGTTRALDRGVVSGDPIVARPERRRAGGRHRARRGRAAAPRTVAGTAGGGIRWRPLLLVGALVLGLVLIARGAAGMLRELPAVDAVADLPVAGVPEQPPGRAATTAAPSDQAALDWAAVLTRLDQRRAAAIAAGSAPALAEVVDPGGPAFARDLATAQARQAAGLRVEGGRLAIQSVRPESTGTQQATLVVTDERAAYRLVDGDGAVVVSVPARASASWRVVLTGDGSSWRVYDATRAG